MAEPLIGIQVGAVSFVDEGVEKVLDTFQQLARVNALCLATPTWTRGTGGRQVPNHPLPDHGAQEYDLDWRGGSYTAIHPQYYAHTTSVILSRKYSEMRLENLAGAGDAVAEWGSQIVSSS